MCLSKKLIVAMTAITSWGTFEIAPEDIRAILAGLTGLIVALAGGVLKWHLGDMRKKRRMNGEQGKGETCKEDKES